MEIAYGYRFYELEKSTTFTLSVSASEISFTQIGATDIKHILSLRDMTNGKKLDPSSFRDIDRRADSDGTPAYYCRFGSSLLFNSAPTSSGVSYRLRYRKQISEPNFSATNSFPETPSEWDEVIKMLAASRGFHALFEPDNGELWDGRATKLVSKLPTDEFVESEDQSFGITVRS